MMRGRGESWDERLQRHRQWAQRAAAGIVMVPVVAGSATAVFPVVGAVIAVVFWAVLAAGVVTVLVPVVRWSAPHGRAVASWLRAQALPATGTRLRGWSRAWRVLALRVRMRMRRARVVRRRAMPMARVRALPPGTGPRS